jgi:hypothetical protein
LWVATLDRRVPPRQLPAKCAEYPRWVDEYIYFTTRTNASAENGISRIRFDGSGDENIWKTEFWRGAVAPNGRNLALVTRSPDESSGPRFKLNIIDWQSGRSVPICTNCVGWWSDNGDWFAIAEENGSGERPAATYILPTGTETGLPEVPRGGFATLADAARAKGVHVINSLGELGLGSTPDRYAFVRETVHRNLYRIPLR